ncbi:MAG: PTS system mannose/fructose/N-acetylgalactosamine-transporter subunit IIB [Anaerorhabdus sp.]
MIKMIRLDERMIHGQVAIKWSRHLAVDRILVANDDAASNSIIQKSLMMAAPPTAKVGIKTVEESITLVNDDRASGLKILLIVSNPKDLLHVMQSINEKPVVNVGNYGRIAPKENDVVRKTYRPNLYAYDQEVTIFKETLNLGMEVIYQTTPEDVPEKLEKIII